MKVAIVCVLLFATVLCRPARKVSDSSESSEEVVRRPVAPALKKQALVVPQARAAPVQKVGVAAAAKSDESTESSDEDEQVAVETPVEVKSVSTDTTSASDTTSINSKDSEDSNDDDDEAEESETDEEEEDESSDSSESGESSTPTPITDTPGVITEEPVVETTEEPIIPTIVTDTDSRGDNLGGYPGDYKSIVYVEDKSYHKVPGPYKSFEFIGTGKKMTYDKTSGNEVEKSLKVYKVQALQVHTDLLEEDTSTPEVESQGLDTSSGTSQDQHVSSRQASLPEEEESASTPEEEEEEDSASTTTASASTSQESEDKESQSSEEATATPGAADSQSDESDSTESDSDEEGAGPDNTTDMPAVITAK